MKIVGITGKSGSGKSTVAEALAKKLNCQRIDVDKIGHKATNDEIITKKLCETFGNQILEDNKKIDRKKLGNLVFSSKEKMDMLTDITWGYMQEVLDKILEKDPENIILEWALLPVDKKYWNQYDIKILIQANDMIRKNKVIQRDKITEEYFEKRDANSIDYSQFDFDYVFENNYQLETIEKIVTNIK